MRCETCGTVFTPRRRDQKFCAARCRVARWHRRKVETAVQAVADQADAVLTARDAELRRHLEAALRLLDGRRTP
jgi:uncharacterized OB-fold protein